MAQPSIRCLNAPRRMMQKSTGGWAAFSSSAVARAEDDPSRRSAAADLLASFEDTPSPPSSRASALSGFGLPKTPPTASPVSAAIDRARAAEARAATNPDRINLSATASPRPRGPSVEGASRIQKLIAEAHLRKQQNRERESGQLSLTGSKEIENLKRAQDLSRQITRRWKAGDVYAPHDLSAVEMAKWKNRGRPTHDVFDVLDFKPMEHYRNFSIMSEYMTPMGRIKHSNETGLRPVNQRRIARAIRRSIGMGMMPSVHRHPEILYKIAVRSEQMSPTRRGPF